MEGKTGGVKFAGLHLPICPDDDDRAGIFLFVRLQPASLPWLGPKVGVSTSPAEVFISVVTLTFMIISGPRQGPFLFPPPSPINPLISLNSQPGRLISAVPLVELL